MLHLQLIVAVPARGAGCIWWIKFKNEWLDYVAVPVRGAGCIGIVEDGKGYAIKVAVPVRGAGCIVARSEKDAYARLLPSPRGVRVASNGIEVKSTSNKVAVPVRGAGCIQSPNIRRSTLSRGGCCPREGCGLHPGMWVYVLLYM